MGTYFPMSEDRREDDGTSTMLYLRDPLPINSQTQTPVLTTNTTTNTNNVVYMNFSSSSGPYSDSIAASNSHIQPLASDSNSQVLLSFGLSLGSHGPSVMQIQYPNENPHYASILGCNNAMMSGEDRAGRNLSFENGDSAFQSKQSRGGEYVISGGLGSGSDGGNDYGALSVERGVPNSKYLKAAQELLDEVVNVKQAIKEQNAKKESGKEVEGESGDNKAMDCSSGKAIVSELSVVEKHELQNKLTKLLSMLDEVDSRYRQYYHQMQIVMSSFDVIAGSGASKPYTALALQTISRHFRCLRDAINGQINVARKSLGEEDSGMNNNNRGVGISRLRFVDQQLRQQRALQQLGMMQQHAWRPQRGLPESSVSILRAWLFEHFLHPYPKDSDKIMLARQTGLTRSQVSNWFINARVRLWKPMVEEMYKEEAGDADVDSNSSSETIPKAASKAATKASKEKVDDVDSKSDQMMNEEMMTTMQDESENNYSQRPNPFSDGIIETSSSNDRLIAAAYHMSELERFANARSGVSLTLGLQQCEGGSMAVDPGFITIRDADVYNSGPSGMGPETEEFECLDSSSRPHQFVTSLLPSFS